MSEEIFAYQEALRRIRDNFRTKATKLDLSDLDNLTDIPLEIGKLNHLTELLMVRLIQLIMRCFICQMKFII
jgi:hypothetical protein